MKISGLSWTVLVSMVFLCVLILACPSTAYAWETNEEPPPIDCANPLPGQTATLGVDDEILVALTNQSRDIEVAKYDNTASSGTDLSEKWLWRTTHGDYFNLRSAATTTGDLDGDDKAEVITVYCTDYEERLTVFSLKNPEVSSGVDYDFWTSESHDRQGGEMGYIMDIASGNLDGAKGGDDAAEVVTAFQDNDKDLQLVLLDGESDGGVKYLGWWWSESHARTDVEDIAVAVGDLDGDGIDDEIVVALSDHYEVLQVIVLEYNGNGGLTELAYARYSGAYEVDVTTGVFSGNGRDQFAVVFPDSEENLHVALFEYETDGNSIHHLDSYSTSGNYRDEVESVSIAAGDIDGDQWDEIVTAFADRNDYFQAVTLDVDGGQIKWRGSAQGTNASVDVSYVSVDAGDIDSDGKAEVVASFKDYDSLLQILSFDDDGEGMHLSDHRQDGSARFTDLAMGDVDGNNVYGDYTGQCEVIDETRLISIVDRPPYWEDLNPSNEVGYGTSIKGGEKDQYKITNQYGSSVTFGSSFKFGGFKLGSSFTKDWTHSNSQSWTHGSSLQTKAGWIAHEDGMVTLNTVTYYAYQYKERDGDGLSMVSVPVGTQTDAKLMTYWNQDIRAREHYTNSWVPAYRTGWMNDRIISEDVGDSSQGAGSDYYDIDGDGYQDYLFAWIDNPSGENAIHYRIAWHVHADGNPTNGWSDTVEVSLPIGWENAGLGVALTELNGSGGPELVVAWIAAPAGENWAAYSIGWDLNSEGQASSWSGKKAIPGWIGGDTQGVGLDIVNLDDGLPSLVFGWIDNVTDVNRGVYRVGWHLDGNGDVGDGWSSHIPIEGAFGTENKGLGLTVVDLDDSGQPELVAAWIRDLDGKNEWAYSVGENLDDSASVTSWAPGYGVPGWLHDATAYAALASANVNQGDDQPELVIAWIDENSGANKAWLQVGKTFPLAGEVNRRPTDIEDADPDDGRFKIKLLNAWWNVSGNLLWRWDKTQDGDGDTRSPIYVSVGEPVAYWKVDQEDISGQTTEESDSYNYKIGGEAEFLNIGFKGARTWGFKEGHSYTISWQDGLLFDGQSSGLPESASWGKEYKYVPFTYMQEALSKTGIKQAYMVVDYFVPWRGTDDESLPPIVIVPVGITPGTPLIDSTSHPDPNAWYANDHATFYWTQPGGDSAQVAGYRWYLDHTPDTIPGSVSFGLVDNADYESLSDGEWWLHVLARGDGGDWSDAAHRRIRIDNNPPLVEIKADPPTSSAAGWRNVPVTITVQSTDTVGSGVAGVEYSMDGVNWQPYGSPVTLDADLPLTQIQARASDQVGHISDPVSVTVGLDLSLPVSVEAPGCWELGGDCYAGVITDTVGNQRLHLRGQVNGSLSGENSLAIVANGPANGEMLMHAQEIDGGLWSFTSNQGGTRELGAGCHSFAIRGEDAAGNIEPLHEFGPAVAWLPRERPDLSGSRITVIPDPVRPGEAVSVTVAAANGGWQEVWTSPTVQLPDGVAAQAASITNDGVYDPDSHTISWPAAYLWPGQERRMTFGVQVNDDLATSSLNFTLTVPGSWPIADECPADAAAETQGMQNPAEKTAALNVDPALPSDGDMRPPAPGTLRIEGGITTQIRDVTLQIGTSEDARMMYLKEWAWSNAQGAWATVQESGWLPYTQSHAWTLSEGDGVKYIGLWLADGSWNISTSGPRSLAYVNLVQSVQTLSEGERIQYRFPLRAKELAIFNVTTNAGDTDLHVWQPNSGFHPHYSSGGTGVVETVGFEVERAGLHLVEVHAQGDSQYRLLLSGDIQSAAAEDTAISDVPDHPITVSDPRSAGVAYAPLAPNFRNVGFLPVILAE